MGKAFPEPAKKSYFFEKGYLDLKNTITDAFKNNNESIEYYKNNVENDLSDGIAHTLKAVINYLAIIAVLLVGYFITFFISFFHVLVLGFFMIAIYVCFSIIWLTDRLYLVHKKIFTACHECKGSFLIPTYICSSCSSEHRNLTPGVYGILTRVCNCGAKLPTTFFNGRPKLEAICPLCKAIGVTTKLEDRETRPICIPVIGGRSVGKTAFITAFSKDFIEKIAPSKSWEVSFYNNSKKSMYDHILHDYNNGSSRMTPRPQDINSASSISFSFFIKGKVFNPDRLVHLYDIAGEVFTDNFENEIQKQYEYCHGIVLVVDPFSIPEFYREVKNIISREDDAGIGRFDINVIIDAFFNKLRQVTGLSDEKMFDTPLAVIINKSDSAGLYKVLSMNVSKLMKSDKYKNRYDAQDYVCRSFLEYYSLGNFVNALNLKFKNNRYFFASAIGHSRDHGSYNPIGIMEPMEWILRNADPAIARVWNDSCFTKYPVALKEFFNGR